MKKIMVHILSFALLITMVGCGVRHLSGNSKEEKGLVDLSSFNIVTKDYEPGDARYKFELSKEQQSEFQAIMQTERWQSAGLEELPQHGLTGVLSARSDELVLYLSPWQEKDVVIIKILPIEEKGDGSDSVYYFAPYEIGKAAADFMEQFKISDDGTK